VLLMACLAVAACAPRRPEALPPTPTPAVAQAPVPKGARVFEIDADASTVTMLVGRAGKLSSFGHLHVFTSGSETGRVWFGATPDLSGFEVRLLVSEFVVDDPQARAAAGPEYAAKVPDDARTGTRRNLLGPEVLDAANHPEVVVSSIGPIKASPPSAVNVRMVVRGAQQEQVIPVEATVSDGVVTAKGSFRIRQSDFGIKPLSIAGGVVAVADEVEVRFDIVARAVGASR
jgi:polyisoprenoid-binding protein YceI